MNAQLQQFHAFFVNTARRVRLARRPQPHTAPKTSLRLQWVTAIVLACLRFAEEAERYMAKRYLESQVPNYVRDVPNELGTEDIVPLQEVTDAYGWEEWGHGKRLEILAQAYLDMWWNPLLWAGKFCIWLGLQLVSHFRLAIDSALLALGEIGVMHFYTDVLSAHPDPVLVAEGIEIAQDEAHHIGLHSWIARLWLVGREKTFTCRYLLPALWWVILVIVWLTMTWPMSWALGLGLEWSSWKRKMLGRLQRRLEQQPTATVKKVRSKSHQKRLQRQARTIAAKKGKKTARQRAKPVRIPSGVFPKHRALST